MIEYSFAVIAAFMLMMSVLLTINILFNDKWSKDQEDVQFNTGYVVGFVSACVFFWSIAALVELHF